MSTWESERTLEEGPPVQIDLEQVSTLVEYIIDSWDMSALISYATDGLMEYYSSPEGNDDFQENYLAMLEVMGTPKKYHGGE